MFGPKWGHVVSVAVPAVLLVLVLASVWLDRVMERRWLRRMEQRAAVARLIGQERRERHGVAHKLGRSA